MSYNAIKIFLVTVIISYFYVAFYVTSHVPEGEVYPFFSWFVFTRVPPESNTEYTLKILEYEGRKLDPPIFLKDAYKTYLTPSIAPPTYNYIVQSLADNVIAEQPDKVEQYRNALEGGFLSREAVYEIVEIRFDTLEYYKTGKFYESESVAIFRIGL